MEKRSRLLTIGILTIGLIFITIGMINGQQTDVMNKAIRICLECIGIG